MALVVRNTLLGGRRRGLLTSLGVLTGNLIHISYCSFGVAALISQSIVLYGTLRMIGAAYLIVLGVQGFRAPRAPAATTECIETLSTTHKAYTQGLLNNLLNPKGTLFYLGVFSQSITPNLPRDEAALMVIATVATSALFWLLFVYTLHTRLIQALVTRFRQSIDRIFGVVLITLGLRVAVGD